MIRMSRSITNLSAMQQRMAKWILYRISRQLNEECRNAIEEAIADNFDGMNLADDATKSVVEQFGMERMGYILAYTLNYNNHDGRYSHSNKEWGRHHLQGRTGQQYPHRLDRAQSPGCAERVCGYVPQRTCG